MHHPIAIFMAVVVMAVAPALVTLRRHRTFEFEED
jgi:hypothetical protein